MKESLSIKVNDAYEFKLHPDEVNQLDLYPTGKEEFHVLEGVTSYGVRIRERNLDKRYYEVEVGNAIYRVNIYNALDELIENMGFSTSGNMDVSSIEAPMPGLILDLYVNEGQEVEEGDPLLVLEAMKMENVIASPRAGTIKRIGVNKGDAVDKKALLIEFE